MLFLSVFPEALEKENAMLLLRLDQIERILSAAPAENLIIHRRPEGNVFTVFKSVQDSGKVLKKEVVVRKNDPLLPKLIEKYCAVRMRKVLKKSLYNLQHRPSKYDPNEITSFLERLSEDFGSLLPYTFFPNTLLEEEWQKKYSSKNTYMTDALQYTTQRGDLVRSKNECIAANILYTWNIPYIYEMKLILDDKTHVLPDFTILSPVNGQIYYIEICGMMSDPSYAEGVFKKINVYARNGIVLGKDLLLVFESDGVPFDALTFENIIRNTVLKKY